MMSPWEPFERKFLGKTAPFSIDSTGILLSPAAAAFRSRLVIDPIVGSRLVNVRFRAYDPKIAMVAVNTLIINMAPILAMADTPVVCPFTDGLVLVVSAEVTSRPSIQRSVGQVHGVGGKLLGVVLNKVNLERNSYYAMGALAAFYEDVPVAHVEAGLRSGVTRNPFPEDMNRRLVACLASFHFAPTDKARANLLAEGVPGNRVHVVGNTVINALFYARSSACAASAGHDPVESILSSVRNVQLLPPLPYLRFVRLLLSADLMVTDSGGVLEEATTLGIPTLIVRRTTERGEAIEAGVAELVPPDAEQVFRRVSRLLTDAEAYRARARPSTVFGDGRAAERIARVLVNQNG